MKLAENSLKSTDDFFGDNFDLVLTVFRGEKSQCLDGTEAKLAEVNGQ